MIADPFETPLFILEMANNHMGSLEHGVTIVRRFAEVVAAFPGVRFAFKLQYRQLDDFIHPAFKGRADVKYVKRFEETRLSEDEFRRLVAAIREHGFLAMCTAFDEGSVDWIEAHGHDVLKIGSCSMTDWPLLERVARTHLPIVFSTAGASVEEIDRVVSFFQHRHKRFAVMHCVGLYPTPDAELALNQIDWLRARYPGVPVGYSTHENPKLTAGVRVAVAKGARLFEKHVGVRTDAHALNDYSAEPEDVRAWVAAAMETVAMCGPSGDRRAPPRDAEVATLRTLRRGVFAKRRLEAGERVDDTNTFLAIPVGDGQLTASDLGKYNRWTTKEPVDADAPVSYARAACHDARGQVDRIAKDVKALLRSSGVVVPGQLELEISHHYGIERFYESGAAMVTLVNRGYCKKLIVVLAGQHHPEQHHLKKEETFHVLWGELDLVLDGAPRACTPGDVVLVEPGVRHAFSSKKGCVIEELSSTHYGSDSYYTDDAIQSNRDRKTFVTHWLDEWH